MSLRSFNRVIAVDFRVCPGADRLPVVEFAAFADSAGGGLAGWAGALDGIAVSLKLGTGDLLIGYCLMPIIRLLQVLGVTITCGIIDLRPELIRLLGWAVDGKPLTLDLAMRSLGIQCARRASEDGESYSGIFSKRQSKRIERAGFKNASAILLLFAAIRAQLDDRALVRGEYLAAVAAMEPEIPGL